MKLGKIATAILNRTRIGSQVYPLRYEEVAISGIRAVLIAKQLDKEGLITFRNSSEYNTRIGNNWDGSYKYGSVYQGVATIVKI